MNVLRSGVGFETVQSQAPSGVDGQGLPSYAVAVPIKARVVRTEKVERQPDGSNVAVLAELWIDALQPVLPLEDYKLTLIDGLVGIVMERKENRALNGTLDHIKLRLRRA
jgi:hypothetical protein